MSRGLGDVYKRQAVVLPPEEPEKLAQAIMNLVDDASYAERLSEAGPAYVKKKI